MGLEPALVRWPPLRLARLRLERVSVVVVCPRFSPRFNDREEDEVKRRGRAIGLDVHLEFCEVAIVEAGVLRSAGRIETTPERLELFAHSLGRDDWVALEVCGSAWEVARILEPHVERVVVVSPNDTGIRQARAKTDRLDARTLARLLWAGELDAVWTPDEQTAVLRRRLSRRERLVRARSRAKNEIHAVLMRRLKGKPPFAELFGVKARRWLAGLELPVEEQETVAACLRHVEFLDREIAAVDALIAGQALESEEVRRLMTVPGVNVICAQTFLAAVGDIRRFPTARKLVGYLGLDRACASPVRRRPRAGGSQSRARPRRAGRSSRPPGRSSGNPARCTRSTSVSAPAAATRSPSSPARASSPCCSGARSAARRTTPTSSPR
jgi:transposase